VGYNKPVDGVYFFAYLYGIIPRVGQKDVHQLVEMAPTHVPQYDVNAPRTTGNQNQ
tara:strand:+ start:1790 stop:1957 length:168 start_codon:yes stop_codon:yes gene_type:complete